MKGVKVIAALCFLTGIAIALAQPALDAGGHDTAAPEHKRKEATPSGPAEEGETPPEGLAKVVARYPKKCLRKAPAAPSGLVAARRGSTATAGFPDQAPVTRIGVTGDVAWSPSGTFLADRGGRVFDQSGNPQGALFFDALDWQWSPVADCALAMNERGKLTVGIPDTPRTRISMLNAPVEEFEVSPNGRRLAGVLPGRGLHVVDLKRGRGDQMTQDRVSIVGWFSNGTVLYSKSPGSGKLRHARGSGKAKVVRGASAEGTFVRCDDRRLLLSLGKRPALAELTARRGRVKSRPLAAPPNQYRGYSGATCSPDGSFLAASTTVRKGKRGPLVLLRRDGSFVRVLDGGRTANPLWSSDGLMYVKFGKADRGRLWLIAPGAGPRPTQYRVGAPTQYDWHVR